MRNLSLKSKTFSLLIVLILLVVVPLTIVYVRTTRYISDLGMDPSIEQSLSNAIASSTSPAARLRNVEALKKYKQIEVLKERIVGQVVVFSALYTILVLIFSIIAGYFLISRITRPLKELTNATKKIAKNSLDEELKESVGGEIGQLVKSFNKMVSDLRTANQQRALAERRATWQRIARTIAHEIKNPLTPIKLSTERLIEKFLTESPDFPDVLKSTTNTILSEISNMQKLVETFHRYAKFPDPVLKPENLNAIIEEACDLYNFEGIEMKRQLDPDVPSLMLDRGQIKEALGNILKNAAEATKETGKDGIITVESHMHGESASVIMGDNGTGISPEDQKKVFQPYFTTKKHGNGIGLALTERIISLNNGMISFESEKGIGTKFRIDFNL